MPKSSTFDAELRVAESRQVSVNDPSASLGAARPPARAGRDRAERGIALYSNGFRDFSRLGGA